ncbi:hypothetical protein EGW08_003275 [Elysia chlorotica]|uniref:Uncharacterized protein n=1 Tax=Elysia chlorotica TaxID=188477 RepID=A0A3S1BI96_ELYCH|nr:hypothetical protein EGW08_003275 [Elysia chlorotica]
MSRARSLSSGGGVTGRSSLDQAWPPSPTQRTRARSLFDQLGTGDGNETSDWSSTGSLVSGREKSSPKDRTEEGGGGLGEEMLHQVISERITEVTEERERRSSLDELVASAEKKLGKEVESQMFSEKETDTLSDFSSSSLSKDVSEIPKARFKMDQSKRSLQPEASAPVQTAARPSIRNGNENRLSPSVSSVSESKARPSSYLQNGSTSYKDRTVETKTSNGSARLSPILTPDTAGAHSSTPIPSRPQVPSEIREENVKIRIKRPRDYIHQWEDTIDRLSNVSVMDKMGSPRTPLISSYNTFTPNSATSRSRSYEQSIPTSHSDSAAGSSSSYSRRSMDLQRRSKSSTLPIRAPQITVSPSYSNDRDRNENGNVSIASTASLSKTEICQEPALTSILDRLPPEMRQQARDASKFLMQSTGPEVMALMDAIKRARTTDSAPRYQPPSSDASEQTILKRRDIAPPAAQSSGARVRFQPQSRSVPSYPSTQPDVHLSSSPLPPTSPRVQSSSPRRRAVHTSVGVTQTDSHERGSHRMLSISPRGQTRSRSLSPSAVREVSVSTGNTGNVGGVARASSPRSLSLREDLLIRNLGMQGRVVEDERPSARLIALTSSPRVEVSLESSGRMHAMSPRRQYPEVTRLDLGLDSDRSFASYDGGNEDGALTPPPLRRSGSGGGAGRLPRREAWEQQRRRKVDTRVSSAPAAKEDMTTPEGQSRFIEVLCKEIDALKAKVDSIEEDSGRRNVGMASRSPSTRPVPSTRLSYSSLDVRDEDNRMVFQPPRYSTFHTQSVSPRRDRATSCPLLETSSRSHLLTGTRSSPRDSAGQPRRYRTPSSMERRTAALGQLSVDTSSATTAGGGTGIVLGYSSPARSVTPEVWGYDLNSSSQGFEPERQDGWKRLITTRNLNEQQIIELKQALACALVENDILTAKLNNARHEIHDKLHHTNGVLDDCRRHLAKSQAENQELRTMLEQERSKSHGFEARIREMETSMNEVKVGKQQLESELSAATSRLNRSLSETKPGVEALKSDNARLVSRLAAMENENETLREDVKRLRGTEHKAMLTMDELRECLSKVRRERQELFDEVSFLQHREQTARVRQIMDTYQEKGSLDQQESEPGLHGIRLNTSSRNASFYESDDSDIIEDDIEEEIASNIRATDTFGKRSVSPPPLRRSLSQSRLSRLDELSPTRGDREIYPHRKTYTPRSRSVSPRSHERYTAASPRYFGSSAGAGAGSQSSLIDQTLQEIERDLQRERETILSTAESALRRSRPSDASLPGKKETYTSTSPSCWKRKQALRRSGSSSRSPLSSMRRRSSPMFSSTRRSRGGLQHGSTGEPIYPRSAHSRDSSVDGAARAASSALNTSFCSVDERHQTGSPRSTSARASRDSGRSSIGGFQSTPASPARSPRYFPRTAHSPPTRLAPEEKEHAASDSKTSGRADMPSKSRPLYAKSGKGEIARNLQREFDKEDKLLNSLANSSVVQNKSWFEMQSESDGDDTGINSSMSSWSSCERPHTGRTKTPFLSDEQRRYADELIHKYTGNFPH